MTFAIPDGLTEYEADIPLTWSPDDPKPWLYYIEASIHHADYDEHQVSRENTYEATDPGPYVGPSYGNTPIDFAIVRTDGGVGAVSIQWQAIGTGAHPADGADFMGFAYSDYSNSGALTAQYTGGAMPSGTLEIPDGIESTILSLLVTADSDAESTEFFGIELVGSPPAEVRSSQIIVGVGGYAPTLGGVILNDDPAPAVTALEITSLTLTLP